MIVDGKNFNLNDDFDLLKTNPHTIHAVMDKLSVSSVDLKDSIFTSNLKTRLNNSIEQATKLSVGLVILKTKESEILYS